MAPYKRCASRMYWSTACRAWVSVLSAASRTLCDRSDCPLPLNGLEVAVGCLAIVALLGCLIQVDAGSMNFLAQPSPAVAQWTALVTALRIPPPLRSLARGRYQLQPVLSLYSGTPVSVGIIEQSA